MKMTDVDFFQTVMSHQSKDKTVVVPEHMHVYFAIDHIVQMYCMQVVKVERIWRRVHLHDGAVIRFVTDLDVDRGRLRGLDTVCFLYHPEEFRNEQVIVGILGRQLAVAEG